MYAINTKLGMGHRGSETVVSIINEHDRTKNMAADIQKVLAKGGA